MMMMSGGIGGLNHLPLSVYKSYYYYYLSPLWNFFEVAPTVHSRVDVETPLPCGKRVPLENRIKQPNQTKSNRKREEKFDRGS
jgi:hypothetical protein